MEAPVNSVRIVADGGCDLSPALAEQYQITLVPVFVRFGQESISSDELTSDEFWQRAARSPEPPGTSSPAPGTFQHAFEKLVSAGHDVVCLTLPGRYSGTFNAAWLAAEQFDGRVRVVDSGSFSLGMGLQALIAAKEALAGRSIDLIERTVESLRERTSVIFVLDTLEWVRRGGRLDVILPLIDRVARTLHVKPVLELSNSEFQLVTITRSSRNALLKLEEEVRSRLPIEALATAYTRGCSTASELAVRIAAAAGCDASDVLTVEAGPAFAAHAGPNALGAAVIRA
jgi:DegV family protein with EDD domain